MTEYEKWSLVVAIVALLANFGALLFIAVQLVEARRSARSAAVAELAENERRSREATLNYYYRSFGERTTLSATLPTSHEPDRVAEVIKAAVDGDVAQRTSIRSLLSYYETLSTGVNLGIYDLATIDRLAGGKVVALHRAWAPYVEWARTSGGNASLYTELDELARRLSERRSAAARG